MAMAEEEHPAPPSQSMTAPSVTRLHLQQWRQARAFPVNVVNGENVTREWLEETGFAQPTVVLSRQTLGIVGPPEPFSLTDVQGVLSDEHSFEVFDSCTDDVMVDWTLAQWEQYLSTPPSQRSSYLRLKGNTTAWTPPTVVTEIGWVERFPALPSTPRQLQVCAKESHENFRFGPSGASSWHSVVLGKQNVHLIPPTPENLRAYQAWRLREKVAPFEALVTGSAYVYLEAGATLFIPAGWLFATLALEDAVVCRGAFLHDLDLPTQWHCYHLDRKVRAESAFPSMAPLVWHLACTYLRDASASAKAISLLLPALVDDANAAAAAQVLDAVSPTVVVSKLRARTKPPADATSSSSSSSSSTSDSDSSSSSDDDSDSSLGSSVSEVDLAYPKFKRELVATPEPKLHKHLVVKIPSDAFPLKASMVPRASHLNTPRAKKKIKSKVAAEEWYFECGCGQKGANYDDGRRMVQCETCPTWQHTHCAGIPDDQEPPAGYTCFKCNATAPGDWMVQCSCGIRAKNYDDGCRMVACDRCNTWQHTLCAGIPNNQEPPDNYVCLPCATKKRPQKAGKSPKTPPAKPKPVEDEDFHHDALEEDEDDDAPDEDEDEDDAPRPPKKKSRAAAAKRPKAPLDVRPELPARSAKAAPKPKKQPTSVRERLQKKLKMKPTWGRL
ncbi:lysine-specific demethylase PHF2 [Achlya hypogyna]|uniref:Lysine-specific demethylase PHF2 n=1 Tax=Achlya hypogyna TaxID=1202772 RepID=A0A1V9YET5_ACHHY|nr:lysine-specific demethylase PHF2 [Achlya hypogyna]